MSSDTKYDAGDARLVEDDVVLSDHAINRYRERTPHDCEVGPRQAWAYGENVQHPTVAQSEGEQEPPERVRVYKHGQDWGIVFLVGEADDRPIPGHKPFVVLTCIDIQGFDHGPTRAYLHSHGPHGGER